MHFPAGEKARRVLCFLGRSREISGLNQVLKIFLFICAFFPCVPAFSAESSVNLSWDPCLDASVAGYRIYYGTTSHDYTAVLDVGDVTNATISGLTLGVTYYFAATTYDASGDESDFSNEATRVAGAGNSSTTQSRLKLCQAAAGQFILTVSGPSGHTYEILASADLKNWTVIATATLDSGGLLNFTDTAAANYPQRFYQLREAQAVEPGYARAQLQLQAGTGKSCKLTVTGLANHTYDIEATSDFMVWIVIGTVTPETDGAVDFTDPNAGNFAQRFYRTRENL